MKNVLLMKSQHTRDLVLSGTKSLISRASVDQDPSCHMVSLGTTELILSVASTFFLKVMSSLDETHNVYYMFDQF